MTITSSRKRRGKPLTNAEALAWLRGKDGIEVDSYVALGLVWGWERSRTSKAVKAWQEAGKVTVEQAGGKITIRIAAQEPSAPAGTPGPAGREIPPREEREIHIQADRENDRQSHHESEREIPREIDRENARPFTEVELETAQPIPGREATPAASVQQPPAASVPAPAAHADIGIVGAIYLAAATLAALGLEIVPVYFAVKGFVGLMPREPAAAFALAVVIDGAKMASVGFLSALWYRLSWFVIVLVGIGIAITATISAFSVYTQIVAAHLSDQTVAKADAAAVASGEVMRLEATVLIQRRAAAERLGFDAFDPDQVFGWQAAAIVLCADPFALALMWAVGSGIGG